jgi:perosamine synthetase
MSVIPRHRIEVRWESLLPALFLHREKNIRLFKDGLEGYFNRKVILLQSGRAALYYLLRGLPQETVIIPAYTCKVVPEAVLLAGKRVVYVDIDPGTLNMDPDDLERKIEPQSVILATHQFGIPCDMGKIGDLAREHRCVLLEDCAAAFGSRVEGKLVGTSGLAGIFSFEFTKALSAGRGGFILFNDENLYGKVRRLTEQELRSPPALFAAKVMATLLLHKLITVPFWYGLFIRTFYRRFGFSLDRGEIRPSHDPLYLYTLSSVEATLGGFNLRRIEEILQRRWEVACRYQRGLESLEGIGLPVLPPRSFCSWMRFPVRILQQDRRDFYLACLKNGLDLGFTYTYSCSSQCENSQLAARQMVNLPMNSNLTDAEVAKVIRVVKEVIRPRGAE